MAWTLTKTDIQKYRQLTGKTNVDILNNSIIDAKFVDMQELLGVQLYEDLETNTANHTDLIEGSTYEYNGVTYTNVGLEIVWAHYAYARHKKFGGSVDTPYGTVTKTNPNSTQETEKGKQVLYTANKQTAFKYWDNVRRFLDRTDYDLWNIDNDCSNNNSSFRISSIGKR